MALSQPEISFSLVLPVVESAAQGTQQPLALKSVVFQMLPNASKALAGWYFLEIPGSAEGLCNDIFPKALP